MQSKNIALPGLTILEAKPRKVNGQYKSSLTNTRRLIAGTLSLGCLLTGFYVLLHSPSPYVAQEAQGMTVEAKDSPYSYGCVLTSTSSRSFDCTTEETKRNAIKYVPFHSLEEPTRDAVAYSYTGRVTKYTSRPQETDSTPCISATGDDICKLAARGVKVCAANDVPLGSRLSVEGLGTCIVLDRMNKRYTGTGAVDWYNRMDVKGSLAFGAKNLQIIALED